MTSHSRADSLFQARPLTRRGRLLLLLLLLLVLLLLAVAAMFFGGSAVGRAYGIFDTELDRLGLAGRVGPVTAAQTSLAGPDLDFVALAKGHGCLATSCRTEKELAAQLTAALAQDEQPWLIEAIFDKGDAKL